MRPFANLVRGAATALVLCAAAHAATFTEQSGVVSMEAENYTTQTGYAEVSDSGASGGVAMRVGSSGSLNFEITLTTGGRWYIWVRTYATDSESNGLYIDLDGTSVRAPSDHPLAGTADIYLKKVGWSWQPEWQGDGSGNHEGPITMDTTAGTHTLSVKKRKSEQPLVDKIVLTTTDSPPSDMGPPETTGNTPPPPPENQVPTAQSQSITVAENGETSITLGYTDDGLPGGSVTFSITSPPSHGTLSGSGASRTYTPDANYTGPDQFSFRVSDGELTSNTATVSISVVGNVAPVADGASVETAQDVAVDITLSYSDTDGPGPYSVTIANGPSHGSLSGSGVNVAYLPDAGFAGSDSFTWKVNDGEDDSNTATVAITVQGDADGDGLPDYWESQYGLDPNADDTDGDGIPDGEEDDDGDGLENIGEYLAGRDPTVADAPGGQNGISCVAGSVAGAPSGALAVALFAILLGCRGLWRIETRRPTR